MLQVREIIMKHLDIPSLVNCRRVSKSWNATASSLLRKRPVWIKRDWDSETFARLHKRVKNSTNFPFCGLDLTTTAKRSANLNYSNVTKLFTQLGRIFTHLRANSSLKWHAEMLSNLLRKALQLQYLEIGNLVLHMKIESTEMSLPVLRILSFRLIYKEGDEGPLVQIIRAAPKLEEIQHVGCGSRMQMAAIRKTWTLPLVSSLTLYQFTGTHICSELAGNPPQLTALTVEYNRYNSPHFLAALKAILEQSQNCLKKLQFSNFCDQLDDLPTLYKVEELDFRVDGGLLDQSRAIAPVLPHLTTGLFPKLKRIQFEAFREKITEEFVHKHLWGTCEAPLDSVDRLEIMSYCEPDGIKYLANCFPQVTYISLDYSGCKYGSRGRHDSNIWLFKVFPFLSKLDIHDYPFFAGNMDSFLTGIQPEIVAKLRTAPKQILSPFMNEIFRPHGNILELKSMKFVTFL